MLMTTKDEDGKKTRAGRLQPASSKKVDAVIERFLDEARRERAAESNVIDYTKRRQARAKLRRRRKC